MHNGNDDFYLPERIGRLGDLAYDLWWSWHRGARQVFRLLDYRLWRVTFHNPVRMLRMLSPARLEAVARDTHFLTEYDTAIADLDAARGDGETWWNRRYGRDRSAQTIAYFSAEFALHQSLPIYAGGLGVLAGDHCKEASDLGIPLVGVGFMYPQGYFHQRVSSERGQEEVYEALSWAEAPISPALAPDGSPCKVSVAIADRTVWLTVWQVRLGPVAIYLLDANVEENAPEDRELSARLYGGSQENRLRQEIVLGAGGVRALRALGIHPAGWHLNEGHAAFVSLERLGELVGSGRTFAEALEYVRRTTVFTTHTPVAAGHDVFPMDMVDYHLSQYWAHIAGNREGFLALGAVDDGGGPRFNMTGLALRTAARANGVSRRHGEVARSSLGHIRRASTGEEPITSITNGVHVGTWVAREMAQLFERRLGRDWRHRHDEPAFWDRFMDVPDEDLWAVRKALDGHLLRFVRERVRQLWAEGRLTPERVAASGVLLDPEALTIGYARRFTGYKRPELVFHDVERLARIVSRIDRPVQIVFAGKAHPADYGGKEHLQRVFRRALDPRFGGRIAFIEDYDLHVAHFLVQGCDVWLNTPLAPLEASGTSGMKAAMNGVLHLSIGDGWWAEGYTGHNGWLIDGGASDPAGADAAAAGALYDLLERVIVPLFFERDSLGIPRGWLRLVRESIRTTVPQFSTRRMVKQYAEEMYGPVVEASRSRRGGDLQRPRPSEAPGTAEPSGRDSAPPPPA
jgi:starch phosphorylase